MEMENDELGVLAGCLASGCLPALHGRWPIRYRGCFVRTCTHPANAMQRKAVVVTLFLKIMVKTPPPLWPSQKKHAKKGMCC